MAKILTLDVAGIKFADNETDLKFRAMQNGVIISDSTLSATIKIKQVDDGYLQSVSAKWVNNHIVISSGDLRYLPVGTYLLELWLSSSSGYEIYPDSGFVSLSINQNATGISGNLISSITLAEFQQQFSDLAEEVNNNVDDFTKLIPALENTQQVMRGELNDLHAQTDSNTSNIELNAFEMSDMRTSDDGTTYDLAGNAVRTQFKNIKKDMARFVAKKDLISGFLNANIASDGAGGYKLITDATSLTLFFPVISGKAYTVNKGYSMSSYPRLAYSATLPIIGSAVTGYLDFSVNANYKEFTATQNGYAVIKISYPSDVASIQDIQNSVFVYEGNFDSSITKNTIDFSNVKNLNGIPVSDIQKKMDSIAKLNIVAGYLEAQVTASAITKAVDKTKLAVFFPVKQGRTYTIDKKIATNHTRTAYTTNVPNYGDVPSNFLIANSGAVLSNYTFTAVQDGYFIAWILDTTSNTNITFDHIKNNLIAYEGYYDSSYTVNSTKINAVNIDKTFYCGPTRSLTTLKAGLEEATKYMDSTLYVDTGTYDLIQEFGQSWFDNLGTTTMVGLQLKNRVKVIFSPNSKVISHYTGTNINALSLYSPFNAGEYGFTLINLNLESSNCRYAIHDERNGASENYQAIYKNCNIKHDNTQNTIWASRHVIGGGLGTNALIEIDSCTFESDASNRWGVYYHISNRTSSNANYRTKVIIKNNHFKTGTVTFENVTGSVPSTLEKSDFIVTNNRIKIKYAGTTEQGMYNNLIHSYNLEEWNNIVG